jgi:hypothetical protein
MKKKSTARTPMIAVKMAGLNPLLHATATTPSMNNMARFTGEMNEWINQPIAVMMATRTRLATALLPPS